MPLFDRVCRGCHWAKADCFEPYVFVHACPNCGQVTERLIGVPTMMGDEYTIPLVDDTMSRTTQVFRSKSEHRAAAAKLGLRIMEKGDGLDTGRLITERQDREKRLVAWHKYQRGGR